VRGVQVVVVNDGSTDRTGPIADQLARQHRQLKVIHFAENQGYGAALKRGFQEGTGDLVAFLDADGTCDPAYFARMCHRLESQSADIVIGSRLGKGSEMPWVRRLGNRLFALLLGFVSGRAVTDTASGMRVLRRGTLDRLYPLPDGLQFTPAMSARAILDGMSIQEVDISYAERVGHSKLHAVRDGFRFLVAIMSALLVFRPARVFNAAAFFCLLMAVLWGIYPAEYFLSHHALQDGMIFRLLLCSLLLTCAFVFLTASVLAEDILTLVGHRTTRSFLSSVMDRMFAKRVLLLIAIVAPWAGVILVWSGLLEWFRTKQTHMHWSLAMIAVLLLQIAVCAAVTAVLRLVIGLWRNETEADRARRG
jgi:glycosyltransferase involved in cell wall biosynthesis